MTFPKFHFFLSHFWYIPQLEDMVPVDLFSRRPGQGGKGIMKKRPYSNTAEV